MPSFRDIKRKMRRDLHREMRVPALLIAKGAEGPIPCQVRVHTKFDALGDQKGTNFHSAEMVERQPKIIFMREEVYAPPRHAIVSIGPGEAYRIMNVDPADDISISATVVALSGDDLIGLPVPETF